MKNFEDQPATLAIATAPDWAPDNCPPAVVKLIGNEQQLEDLGLRGLASGDSAEFHQGMRRLKSQLSDAFEAGKRSSTVTFRMSSQGSAFLAVAFVAGVLVGALATIAALTG